MCRDMQPLEWMGEGTLGPVTCYLVKLMHTREAMMVHILGGEKDRREET